MRNRLKQQDRTGMAAMAGLLLCLGGLPLSGCLIPQDDQVAEDLPPRRNSPLTIKLPKPTDPRTTFYNSTACPARNPTFSLIVEDEDTADVVSSLWFIDRSADGSSTPFIPSSPPAGTTLREVTSPTSLAYRSALANLSPGAHLLTVYVSDSIFKEATDGVISVSREPRVLPDGGTAEDKGSIDSFTWVLFVEPCP